jgi:hypothetical protein
MRGKLLFITGGLAGYVLGARAGRKRYEQIASAANELWNTKPVQRRVTEVRDFALNAVGDVPSALIDAGKKVVGAVQGRTQKTDAAQSHSRATAPDTTPAGATPDLADPTV